MYAQTHIPNHDCETDRSDYLEAAHSWAELFSCAISLLRNVFFFRDTERCYKPSFLNVFP